ncbi:hypothetical protein LSG31_12630 [Fodinisporobacter ferrooxydans]|uniref:Uncharacterized protein n=1 Tax=Fodinisporobacter ferrooxydans TaxID=2901836 RepID=A0ABY4CEA9_9BACL|nr:hypothetical protein LSG31_12630 [Alicyclobacillaceae bacterium MYW30-H2]
MGYFYKLIKTMRDNHLLDDETDAETDTCPHIFYNEPMKALSDNEIELLKSLSEESEKLPSVLPEKETAK